MNPKLAGSAVIVTGANQGLGRVIAKRLVADGASVLLCARDRAKLTEAREDLRTVAAPGQVVIAAGADVSRQDEVERLFTTAERELPPLTGLVNNAAILGPAGRAEETDWEQWHEAIRINLLGTVLCCREAVRIFRRARYGKIVNLSGGGATAPRPFLSAYAVAKAGVVRFTETLAEETKGAGIDVNAVAPGALNTRLLNEVIEAGPERVGTQAYEEALRQRQEGGAPPEAAAALCALLLSADSDGITGRLLSAVWDNWRDLPARKIQLAASDVYTLRRIVPRDRNFDWD
jgi:NAD(P)-dependent dehydrogenase (short-subunit alcohol dehydrogenase family)